MHRCSPTFLSRTVHVVPSETFTLIKCLGTAETLGSGLQTPIRLDLPTDPLHRFLIVTPLLEAYGAIFNIINQDVFTIETHQKRIPCDEYAWVALIEVNRPVLFPAMVVNSADGFIIMP